MWYLILLPIVETLTSLGLIKFVLKTDKNKELLIHGHTQVNHLPIIDNRLAKYTVPATKYQALVQSKIMTVGKWLFNSRAGELGVLIAIQKYWPGKKIVNTEVVICQ